MTRLGHVKGEGMRILIRTLGWARRHPQRFLALWWGVTLPAWAALQVALSDGLTHASATLLMTAPLVLVALGVPGYGMYHLLLRESRLRGRLQVSLQVAASASLRERELNEALHVSGNFQQAVLDSTSCGIIATDASGAILFISRAATRILGFAADEVIGKMSPLVFHRTEDIRVALRRIRPGDLPYQLMVDHLRAHPAREWQFIRKDGSTVCVSIAITPLRHSNGRQHGHVTIFNDQTELNRLEGLRSDFVSAVSRELRTPLTSIRGALSLHQAAVGATLPSSQLRLLNIANDSCDKLVRIVSDILDIDKLSRDQLTLSCTPESPVKLAEAAIAQTQPFADQYGVSLRLNPSDDDLRVKVDSDRFIQVMVNLLSNAAKFSLPRTEVMVSIRKEFGRAVIRVVDYGAGIPESFRPFIFDRFSQAGAAITRKAGGTGLGLAITKMLVEAHDGTIDFLSEEGFGTTFTISLPVVTGSEAAAAAGPDEHAGDPAG